MRWGGRECGKAALGLHGGCSPASAGDKESPDIPSRKEHDLVLVSERQLWWAKGRAERDQVGAGAPVLKLLSDSDEGSCGLNLE